MKSHSLSWYLWMALYWAQTLHILTFFIRSYNTGNTWHWLPVQVSVVAWRKNIGSWIGTVQFGDMTLAFAGPTEYFTMAERPIRFSRSPHLFECTSWCARQATIRPSWFRSYTAYPTRHRLLSCTVLRQTKDKFHRCRNNRCECFLGTSSRWMLCLSRFRRRYADCNSVSFRACSVGRWLPALVKAGFRY